MAAHLVLFRSHSNFLSPTITDRPVGRAPVLDTPGPTFIIANDWPCTCFIGRTPTAPAKRCASIVFIATIYLWQVPAAHNMAVRSDLIHSGMHITMLISGFMFWWLVIDPKPHRSRLHFGLRILYLGLIVIPNTILGASITFNSNLLYNAYQEFPQPLGLSPLIDQQLGGLILWVFGDMMSILAAGIVMILWYNKEQELEQADS